MPPSPWLSARITSVRYLTEMMTTRAQNTIDATPYAFARVTSRSACSNDSRNAYKRTRADVAVHDAQRTERQPDDAAVGSHRRIVCRHDGQAIEARSRLR